MADGEESGVLQRWGAPLLSVLVLGGVVGLVVVARGAAAASPRFSVDPRTVTVVRHPAWLPPDMAATLASRLGERLGAPASLLDRDPLQTWAGDLPDLSAWIEAVPSVRPRFPGRAEVVLRLRRPVLSLPGDVLLAADGSHLGQGVLPTEPRPLRLVGPASAQDARECAAATAELLPYRAALVELGVPVDRVERGAGGTVVFRTVADVELEWGRSATASEFAAADLPPAARIANLHDVAAAYPELFGVRRVVLWKDRPEVRLWR